MIDAPNSYSARLRGGLRISLPVTAVYCAWVLLVQSIAGDAPFEADGVSLHTVLVAYSALGLVVGVLLGVLRPLLNRRPGAYLAGALCGGAIRIGMGMSRYGLPWRWSFAPWIAVVAIAAATGSVVTREAWKRFGDGSPLSTDPPRTMR